MSQVRELTRENLPHLVDCLVRSVRISIDSKLMRLRAAWWGVKLGINCWFNGGMYFNKHPESEILIGDNCGFNSSPRSNLIGVNRPCAISTLAPSAMIEIGSGCGFSGTVIGAAKKISIGKNVRCGANTLITDTDWHTDDPRAGENLEVAIDDNVWIGVNVTILKGVRIGRGSLIAAGSVVTSDIPENVMAGGIPAKVIRSLSTSGE